MELRVWPASRPVFSASTTLQDRINGQFFTSLGRLSSINPGRISARSRLIRRCMQLLVNPSLTSPISAPSFAESSALCYFILATRHAGSRGRIRDKNPTHNPPDRLSSDKSPFNKRNVLFFCSNFHTSV